MVRGLFSKQEISKLRNFTETDEDIRKYSYGRDDGSGRIAKLCIWNYPGDDVTGVVARYLLRFLSINELTEFKNSG